MIENEKIDCVDSIIFGLNRTKDWRRITLAKYPFDLRNGRAADCLSQLAIEAVGLSNEDWLRLQPHFGWASERFREAISQTARLVGFKHKIKDVPSFVNHLVDILSQPPVVA